MVQDPGAPVRAGGLRPLNSPRPVVVETRAGPDGEPEPVALVEGGRRTRGERVVETWLVEDEWWREAPIARRYYVVELVGGGLRTVYRDLAARGWFAQAS